METISLQEGLEVREVSPDIFENVKEPWTWYGRGQTVPGGLLMGLAASAAYKTVDEDFSIDTLQAHFIAGPRPSTLQIRVQRLSQSGKFAIRIVIVEQGGKPMVQATCSFVRRAAMGGRSMQHCAQRTSKQTIDAITIDDLEPGRKRLGPYMKFQRLPLEYIGPSPQSENQSPEHMLYTSVAQISPAIQPSTPHLQSLGIIMLSDYHVLDSAPTVHGLQHGLAPINARAVRLRSRKGFQFMTSLNHTINFRIHEGFQADDLCYIEVNCPWTESRRSNVQTQIFDRAGTLIASCVQEGYFVMKEDKERGNL